MVKARSAAKGRSRGVRAVAPVDRAPATDSFDERAFWRARDDSLADLIFDPPPAVDASAKYPACKVRVHTFTEPWYDRQADVVCQRCGTQRLQEFDEAGRATKHTYLFPPGYNHEP